ncbi:MAG: DUF433 domain-containing protein [Deltaproteobacteria bacterium]|nr:DUF433 domain-containing protein [Deltaproteobacteria bacterium]MBM4296668.1 DUF433 domain-containing protein [Deltaproteobacteria bacterium]
MHSPNVRSERRKFGKSIREQAAYSITEASRYLAIPSATLRSWVAGRKYPTGSGPQFFQPVIQLPGDVREGLSFVNLIEAHVLDAIRRQHQVPLKKIRDAIRYLRKHFSAQHPLAEQKFQTDGIDLFVEKFGKLINVTQSGQFALRELLKAYLQRVERDAKGAPIRLYPFTRNRDASEPRVVVIDPGVSYGRPVLVGTGIPTAVVADRYKAGESIDELAEDYGRSRKEIEEAIRCELSLEAA